LDKGEVNKEEANSLPRFDVADIPEFDRYVDKGDVIPPDGITPLNFSQVFLQTLEIDEARNKLQVLGENRTELLDNGVKFRIIDIDLGNVNLRREVLCK
jgi:hypothetical protein